MAKGDDIQERLIDFAVNIINLCAEMPGTTAGKHISRQFLRSGTSPAPNYAEARSAESNSDFIHKLRIVLKELNETRIWFDICKRSELISNDKLRTVAPECDELCRIISSSIKTISKRNDRNY